MRILSVSQNTWKAMIVVSLLVFFVYASQQGSDDLFAAQIKPIFEQNCLMCHGAKIQRSGLDLRTPQTILKGGNRGAAIVPGKPEASLLYKLILHQEEPAMPIGGKLSDQDVALIAQWIKQMKPTTAAGADSIPVRNQGYSITAKDRQFWSFIKPVRPAIPVVKNRKWVANEIDSFILSKLESSGLTPSAPAEPRTLIRRVYFDLTGLPPTPEAIDSFVKNPSNQAYEKIIDQLLNSPRYGERWGRHWLDLARYADSGGYEFDIDRPHAWRYRDWVIKAFNEDKPYNQFIIEQLANDQLGTDSPAALIPTGFIRNGPTVDNANNEETRMDELDDMVSTTSSVFLGLTVGCARCHDHKYDPIPQRDYYRMQAIFFPYKKTERIYGTPEEQEQNKAANKAIDEQLKPYKQKIAEIERPVKEKLLAEKTDFQVRLAERSNGFGGLSKEEYRAATLKRLAKDVNIQPEEYEAELSPEKLKERKDIQKQIDEINRLRPKLLPAVMGVTDDPQVGVAHILKRGDWRNKGDEVGPGTPSVFSNGIDLEKKNRRLQLAQWIANPENPLTARVAVNRIWKYHFGSGLVKTPSDFGLTGDRPSHPELLDFLATEFIKRGWSWKQMHKLILMSNTYRQSSRFNEQFAAKDPENRLLWRVSPHRLEAESIRDTILTISNKLNTEMYGPGVFPRIDPDIINTGSRPRWPLDAKDESATFRRSIYIFVKRSVPLPLLEVYDCPITVVAAPNRSTSTVSPQALALMNNEFVLEQARFFSERIQAEAGKNQEKQIDRAFQIALNRKPTEQERSWSRNFINSQMNGYRIRKHAQPEAAALRDFCHAVMNLNEFLYID